MTERICILAFLSFAFIGGMWLGTENENEDERVYRELRSVGCMEEECLPNHRCGTELLHWEHMNFPLIKELNCLYDDGSAKSCHVKPCR